MLGVGFEVFRAGHLARLLQFVQTLFQARQFIHPARGDIHDGLVPDGFRFLGEIADHGPRVALDGAVVRFLLSEDDGEQRGLAGTIRADQGDAVAIVQLQRHVLEERSPTESHL